MAKVISPNGSFKGWDIWLYLKGRKKMAVTVIAALLGLFITDSSTAAVVSGGAVEMIWALAEYYFKKY